MAKIKRGDKVIVIAGAHKDTVGTVTRVFPERGRVVVEGVSRVKRHQKPTPKNPEGGIVEKDRPIHISNVQLVDPTTGKGTRTKSGVQDGKKVRIAIKSGTVIADVKIAKTEAQAG